MTNPISIILDEAADPQEGVRPGGPSSLRDEAADASSPKASIPDAEKLFPFMIHCRDHGNYSWSDPDFRSPLMVNKPDGLSVYAYDVKVRSPMLVTFVVYGMRCYVRGGIGDEKARFDAVVSRSTTKNAIRQQALNLARRRRNDELEAAELAIIRSYADEIYAQGMSAGTAETLAAQGDSPPARSEGCAQDPSALRTAAKQAGEAV